MRTPLYSEASGKNSKFVVFRNSPGKVFAMNDVLVLFDFSAFSTAALKAALHWSKVTKGRVHIFHHVETLLPGLTPVEFRKSWQEDAEKEAAEEIRTVLESITDQNPDEISIHVVSGYFIPRLLELTEKHNFQVIFLGTKGRGGAFSDILSGSVASKVITNLSVPIVAIPQNYHSTSEFDLIVSVNTENSFHSSHLQKLLSNLRSSLRSVEFITVLNDEEGKDYAEKCLSQIASELSGFTSCKYTILEGQDVYEELREIMKHRPNSIMVLQKGEADDVKNVLGRSLVYELLRQHEVPVIILP